MNIKGIFFDLDDTLHDHHAPFARTIFSLLPEESISLLETETIYKTFRFYSDVLWKEYDGGKMKLEQLRVERILQTLKDFRIELSEEMAIQFQDNYEKELGTLTLFSDVPRLMNELKQLGFELGMITNGPTTHQKKKIQQLGLDKYFSENRIFISDQVGIAKPHPEIFKIAEREVKLPAEQLLYIGDSWENDVAAPIEAGWKSVWFNHRGKQPLTKHTPHAEITTLSALLSLVK